MKVLKALMVVIGILFGSVGFTMVILGGLGDVAMIMALGLLFMVCGCMLSLKGAE